MRGAFSKLKARVSVGRPNISSEEKAPDQRAPQTGNSVQIKTSLGDRYDQAIRGPPAPPLNLSDPIKH